MYVPRSLTSIPTRPNSYFQLHRFSGAQGVTVCTAGPDSYRDLPRLLDMVSSGGQNAINVQLSVDETYADIAPVRAAGAYSAFISIMRGCANLCSFCIVPYGAPHSHSLVVSCNLRTCKQINLLDLRCKMYHACYIAFMDSISLQSSALLSGASMSQQSKMLNTE